MEIKHKLLLYIRSQGADAAPPLGTVLGNLGVNTVNFCKEFNSFTVELPPYFTLAVEIFILSNRSYKFFIRGLPLGPILSLLSKEEEEVESSNKKNSVRRTMTIRQVILLAMWQYPSLDLAHSLPILLGTLRGASIDVI